MINLTDSCEARILIRAANWVGDAIMTTPVVRALRKNYPKAQITVLAKPWVVPVYETSPHVNEVMVYQSQGRHRMGAGTLRLARDIRNRQFHLAVLMQNAFEAGLLAFQEHIKSQKPGFHGNRNLCRAGGFGTVTDNA